MTEADALKEALDYWREGVLEGQTDNLTAHMLEDARHFDTIATAARGYLRLLTEGREVEVCVQHDSLVRPKGPGGNPGLRECEAVQLRRLRDDRSTFIMCRIEARVLLERDQ